MESVPSAWAAQPGYCLFDTAFGPMGIAWSPRGLTKLCLPEGDRAATERRLQRSAGTDAAPSNPPAAVGAAIAELQRYLAGERLAFEGIPVDIGNRGAFADAVYAAARAIPWGETATYGELARRAGAAGAAQAVGQAMGSNPVPLIIPCHRVLGSGGRPGGFSAYGGRMTKAKLLALE